MKKNKLIFTTLVPQKPLHSHKLSCADPEIEKLSILMNPFNESRPVEDIIQKIELYYLSSPDPLYFSVDVYKLIVKGETAEFGVLCSDEDKLHSISTVKVLHFFKEYLNYLLDYENCRIKGLIPMNKMDTWSCIPNEYIKDEYWERPDSKVR